VAVTTTVGEMLSVGVNIAGMGVVVGRICVGGIAVGGRKGVGVG